MVVKNNHSLLIQVQRAMIVRLAESLLNREPLNDDALRTIIAECKARPLPQMPESKTAGRARTLTDAVRAGMIMNATDSQIAELIAEEFLAEGALKDRRSLILLEAFYRLSGGRKPAER